MKEHQIKHVMNEGNKVADFFTNFAFSFAGTRDFHNNQEIPEEAKALITMDKKKIPNLRFKILRAREPD